MSRIHVGMIVGLAMTVVGTAPAFAGLNGTESMQRMMSAKPVAAASTQDAAAKLQVVAASRASAARVYPGGRAYHGTDPDAFIRSQLVRDCPDLRL